MSQSPTNEETLYSRKSHVLDRGSRIDDQDDSSKGIAAMKKTYEKPTLVRRETLSKIVAQSSPVPG
jgi:hypothetical protein